MDAEVKKSLDEMLAEADKVLEKSRKASKEKDEKDEKEKPAKQDHEANGSDITDNTASSDNATDKGEKDETHNIDKSRCKDKGEEDIDKSKDKAEKSVTANLNEDENLKKSMGDNTAFLTLFTQLQSQQIDRLNEKLDKSLNTNDEFVKSISKAVTTLLKSNNEFAGLVKSQDEKIKTLEKSIDDVSHQPLARKAALNPRDVQVIQKSFTTAAGLEGNDTLTKGQVLQKLTEAAMDSKSPVQATDVNMYEMNPLIKSLRPEVQNFIANQFKN